MGGWADKVSLWTVLLYTRATRVYRTIRSDTVRLYTSVMLYPYLQRALPRTFVPGTLSTFSVPDEPHGSSAMDLDEDTGAGKAGKANPAARPGAFGASTARRLPPFPIAGNVFEVDVRYTNLVPVGGGSYGLVCSADDSVTYAVWPSRKSPMHFLTSQTPSASCVKSSCLGSLGS